MIYKCIMRIIAVCIVAIVSSSAIAYADSQKVVLSPDESIEVYITDSTNFIDIEIASVNSGFFTARAVSDNELTLNMDYCNTRNETNVSNGLLGEFCQYSYIDGFSDNIDVLGQSVTRTFYYDINANTPVLRLKSDAPCTVVLSLECHAHSIPVTYYVPGTTSSFGYSGSICSKCGYVFDKTGVLGKIADAYVNAKDFKQVYTGKSIKVEPYVMGYLDDPDDQSVLDPSNYDIYYDSDTRSIGTHRIQIKLKGLYSGSLNTSYVICPKTTKISSVKAGKGRLKVQWKPNTNGNSGYELRWSTKKNMSGAKSKLLLGTRQTTATLSKLKHGKKYYVQVRCIALGDSGSIEYPDGYRVNRTDRQVYYQSKWSTAASKKTK